MSRRSTFPVGTELSQIEGAEKHSFGTDSSVRRSFLIARRRFCCSSPQAARPTNQQLTVDDDPGRSRSSDHFMCARYHSLTIQNIKQPCPKIILIRLISPMPTSCYPARLWLVLTDPTRSDAVITRPRCRTDRVVRGGACGERGSTAEGDGCRSSAASGVWRGRVRVTGVDNRLIRGQTRRSPSP